MHERKYGGPGAVASIVLLFCAGTPDLARAQTSETGDPGASPTVVDHPLATAATGASGPSGGADESLTVRGHHDRFQPAPVPGAPLGPPPDKPAAHLGRYKISGDQTKKDGYDTQTGAYIAPFGSAYTTAGPTADGLASRFQH